MAAFVFGRGDRTLPNRAPMVPRRPPYTLGQVLLAAPKVGALREKLD